MDGNSEFITLNLRKLIQQVAKLFASFS